MRIRLITIAQKAPTWLQTGYEEYAKRLSTVLPLELIVISAAKRTANADLKRIMQLEADKMLAVIKPDHYVIALDVNGKSWTTEQLAQQLANWQRNGRTVDLLVGGPEGLDHRVLTRASERWSLSPLTFPHLFVRLIVAEQLYRAYTILTHHPYHR